MVLHMSNDDENTSQSIRKMLRYVCASAALLFVLSSFAQLQSTSAKSADAALNSSLDFVKLTGLGRDIHLAARRFAPKILATRSARVVFNVCGVEKAQGLVNKHFAAAVAKHRPEWDENLAESYEKHFTLKEMRSLYRQREKPDFRKKLRERSGDIPAETSFKNLKVVQLIWNATLKGMFAEAAKTCKSG